MTSDGLRNCSDVRWDLGESLEREGRGLRQQGLAAQHLDREQPSWIGDDRAAKLLSYDRKRSDG